MSPQSGVGRPGSLVTLDAPGAAVASRRAAALFGPGATLTACGGGRNSTVYRVDVAGGRFALKLYPADGRERVEREYGALSFLAAEGVRCVPKPVRADIPENLAVYTWIEGTAAGSASSADIDCLAAFAATLHGLRERAGAERFRDAAEACFTRAEILAQIDARLTRLAAVAEAPELDTFVTAEFGPILARERARSSGGGRRLDRAHQTLSPSDFGLHNSRRTPGGGLSFLDFEYFGWDDPVKLACDVCWHPGMSLCDSRRVQFLQCCADIYAGADANWTARLATHYSLFGLRWCLIVLNDFLPRRRRLAASVDGFERDIRPAQLVKARALLERIERYADGSAVGY